MQPLVLIDGEYSASLDGLTFEGDLLVEIKCPYKGQGSSLWQQVAAGEIPAHYRWQLEHQFMVSKAAKGHLYVFDGSEGLLLEVTPCPERWEAMRSAWDAFMLCIRTDTPPPLMERDKVVRTDGEWQAAAAENYSRLKAEADRWPIRWMLQRRRWWDWRVIRVRRGSGWLLRASGRLGAWITSGCRN
jgi:hypothetical protein